VVCIVLVLRKMRNDTLSDEDNLDYYQQVSYDDSVRFRLDSSELIELAVDSLRGGVVKVEGKKKFYNKNHAFMNELGIQKAKSVLQNCCNKTVHLTKYKNEERVAAQVCSIMEGWDFDLARHTKEWAPNASFKDGKLSNDSTDKVKNKRIINQILENAIYASMLRGTAGFEAELTGKNIMVNENRDLQTMERYSDGGGGVGGMRGFFGGRRGGDGGY